MMITSDIDDVQVDTLDGQIFDIETGCWGQVVNIFSRNELQDSGFSYSRSVNRKFRVKLSILGPENVKKCMSAYFRLN